LTPKTKILIIAGAAVLLIAALAYFIYKKTNSVKMPKTREERNLKAFLRLIQYSEGTSKKPNPYAVVYGYKHTITNFQDHPYYTGEWKGEILPAAMCQAAGLSAGCITTAAGAYQFIRPTWQDLKTKLKLPDFGPESQDKAATELIKRRGALEDVKAGRIATAISKCRKEWASFPGAGYQQPEKTLSAMLTKFTDNGGEVLA
jgi:muramidase (phage lysozyme)